MSLLLHFYFLCHSNPTLFTRSRCVWVRWCSFPASKPFDFHLSKLPRSAFLETHRTTNIWGVLILFKAQRFKEKETSYLWPPNPFPPLTSFGSEMKTPLGWPPACSSHWGAAWESQQLATVLSPGKRDFPCKIYWSKRCTWSKMQGHSRMTVQATELCPRCRSFWEGSWDPSANWLWSLQELSWGYKWESQDIWSLHRPRSNLSIPSFLWSDWKPKVSLSVDFKCRQIPVGTVILTRRETILAPTHTHSWTRLHTQKLRFQRWYDATRLLHDTGVASFIGTSCLRSCFSVREELSPHYCLEIKWCQMSIWKALSLAFAGIPVRTARSGVTGRQESCSDHQEAVTLPWPFWIMSSTTMGPKYWAK